MKLLSLFLQNYRVLREFTLDMAETSQANAETSSLQLANMRYTLDLIVGVNGTGKSTLLRALAEIFSRLEMGSSIPFGFEIRYLLAGEAQPILISNLDEKTGQPFSEFDSRLRWRLGETIFSYVDRIESTYLPPLVVALTTGSERDWQFAAQSFQEHDIEPSFDQEVPHPASPTFQRDQTDWFLRELPGQPIRDHEPAATPLPTAATRFLFLKEAYMPLIILCGILADLHKNPGQAAVSGQGQPGLSPSALQQVLDACNVRALRGFSLSFRMNQGVLKSEQKMFIQALDALTVRHSLQHGSDYLLVFDLAQLDLAKLLAIRENALGLFRMLVSLLEEDETHQAILREVHVFLERRAPVSEQEPPPRPPLHLLTWLSDGEQSFLGRLCLLSLLGSGQSEALILLDEPEVHFNDYWKRRLVLMIDQSLAEQESHVLMSTHSSITLSDVLNRNIRLLRRTSDYTHQASTPTLRTLGTDPDDIMVYIFDAEDARGAQGASVIERELRAIRRGDDDGEKRVALEQLLNQVGPGDLRFLIRRELHALEGTTRGGN